MRRGAVAALLLAGTGCYLGTATDADPSFFRTQPGWIVLEGVPYRAQETGTGSGIAALSMILAYWEGEGWTPDQVARKVPGLEHRESPARDLRACAREAGLESYLIHGSWADLLRELLQGRPAIVGLAKPYQGGVNAHYEVVVGLNPEARLVLTLDPARGWRQNSVEGFLDEWEPTTCLLLVFAAPSPPAR